MSAQIHEPGEGIRTISIGGGVMIAKADATTTDDAFVVSEATLQPGGFVPPLHLHREMAECLYLLSGRLDLHVGMTAGSPSRARSSAFPPVSRTRCRSSARSPCGC
jgi:mannose-6-phosphate isomerase-like protein (cupin superfamily)